MKSVLTLVDSGSKKGWLPVQQWSVVLPGWFVSRCSPQMTREQADQWLARWKALSRSEQARLEREVEWSLDNWLYAMNLENRQWFWWDAKQLGDSNELVVAVEVDCWPFAWHELRWLFIAAGASSFEPEQ